MLAARRSPLAAHFSPLPTLQDKKRVEGGVNEQLIATTKRLEASERKTKTQWTVLEAAERHRIDLEGKVAEIESKRDVLLTKNSELQQGLYSAQATTRALEDQFNKTVESLTVECEETVELTAQRNLELTVELTSINSVNKSLAESLKASEAKVAEMGRDLTLTEAQQSSIAMASEARAAEAERRVQEAEAEAEAQVAQAGKVLAARMAAAEAQVAEAEAAAEGHRSKHATESSTIKSENDRLAAAVSASEAAAAEVSAKLATVEAASVEVKSQLEVRYTLLVCVSVHVQGREGRDRIARPAGQPLPPPTHPYYSSDDPSRARPDCCRVSEHCGATQGDR